MRYMKHFRILILLVMFLFSVDAAWAQSGRAERKEQRKLEKAEKKRLKEEERKQNREEVFSLIQDQTVVLEANTVYGRYMTPYHVTPTTNFIIIEGDQLTLQTASNYGFGYNGLGGITVNGTIQEYQLSTSEKNG